MSGKRKIVTVKKARMNHAVAKNQMPGTGALGFHWHVSVSAQEMRTWEPDRIASFFRGLAQAIRAHGCD